MRGRSSTGVWTRYCGTAAKAGGQQRTQTSSCSSGRLLPTRSEVYRARDGKLDRDVAIKVLPEEFARDKERLARFEREAKLLASLNHPNIASIYGLEESDGVKALVLELVEGPTLAERIAEGPIPIEEALPIARQMAEALEAGHEAGVIHRDVKPANVKLRQDGTVKVLDYGLAKAGLAKALEGEATGRADSELSQSPTLTRKGTQIGAILGTAAYMSPEQAKGIPVDTRSDLFSFGCVLFEMLTGRRAFQGELAAEILASIINREPDANALPANLHPRVRELLERCFEKEPKKRWQAAGDMRVELERALANPDETRLHAVAVAASPGAKLWLVLPWVIASIFVTGVATWILKPSEPRPITRFRYELPPAQQFTSTGRPLVDVSRDGSQFVYVANGQLHLRPMDATEAMPIQGTRIGITSPVFSPDGRWVAYFSGPSQQLKKTASSGGAPVTITDASNPYGLSWSADDTIVYGQPEGIFRVAAGGGVPSLLVAAEDGEQMHGPQLLPGGEAVLFTTTRASGADRWDEAEIVVQLLDSGERKVLWTGGGDARYVPTGHLVYAREDVLFALPFDLESLKVTGGPVPITEGVQRAIRPENLTASANYAFSASGSGALVYVAGTDTGSNQRILALVDHDGAIEPLNAQPAPYRSPRVSPDGRKLAVETMSDEGVGVVWVYDLSGDEAIQQLTFEGDNRRPIWTPDSRYVTFASDRGGTMSLYWKPANGSGVAERLTTADEGTVHRPGSWSPDGRTLSFWVVRGGDDWDIWTLVREGENAPESLYDAPGRMYHGPEFSPDGKWLAYGVGDTVSNQDIYVEPFPPTGARWRISQEGGNFPLWSPDASALFYRRSRSFNSTSLDSHGAVRT